MKKYFKKLAFLITVSLLLLVSCSKDDKSNPSENSLTTAIITPTGGNIETNEGIKISFPANAVSVSTEVSIGYSGTEPTTFPNPNVQILGQAFTIKIAANSLNESAFVEIPKPQGYTNIDETVIVISKEGTNTYYPLFFHESGDKLIAELDEINYQELYPSLRSNTEALLTTIIFYIIKSGQIPSAIEMGLKKVDSNADNTLSFNAVPVLNNTDKVLIMVHGWRSSPSAWKNFLPKIKPQIQCAGYTQYLTFGYNSSLSIDENSVILANLLQTKMNGATVDIVGHSMGGLVTRSAIEDHGCSGIVRNLITLGTPHRGSFAANLRTFLGISLVSSGIFSSDYNINTQGFRDLIPSSVFLTNLNDNPAPQTNYYPIAALINNTIRFDGVVTEASALGIQNNASLTAGKSYVIPGNPPHTAMPDNEEIIILRVAEKLNLYNNAPPACSECNDNNTSNPTVTIGSQIWMQKNLDVCKYRNGDDIPHVQDPTEWAALTTGAWCYYNNDSANGPVYGKLYNRFAVLDPRGLAPTGYHIPYGDEWSVLRNFLGINVTYDDGGRMKSTSGLWVSPNVGATNSSGFTGLPGGSRGVNGIFDGIGIEGCWWAYDYNNYLALLNSSNVSLILLVGDDSYATAFSVRCIKD